MALASRQTVTLALTVLLSGVLLWRTAPYLTLNNIQPGDRAPHIELRADSGAEVDLRDFRGKYVLLNFWATWCPPCVQELPSLNELAREFEERGLVVLGVSVDEDREAYENFLERFDVSFPTVRDPERVAANRYGTMKYPESYLIDRDGVVVQKYVGAENWMRPEIVNYLRSLL